MNLSLPFLLVLALLLGSWFTWLAVRRPDRRRLFWRLLASWGVVACLVLLLAPPYLTRSYNASEAILLTQGYSPDSLRALTKSLRPRPQVFSFGVEATRAEKVTDLASFQENHPAVKTLHVLGNGLPAVELGMLSSIRLIPHLTALPTGVVAASWPHEITLGEELQVQGSFHNALTKGTILLLQAAGRSRNSVQLQKNGAQPFSLRFTPKTAGQFVYGLQWKDAEDSVHQENLPVTVRSPRPLSVLLLSSAPSFEGKFLKNALASQGHHVASRSQVSKGIYTSETINLRELSLNRLTPALLQKFDVVLLDDETLRTLSPPEKQALQQAVRQQGLGVLTSISQKVPKSLPFFAEGVFRVISEKPARNGAVQWRQQTGTAAVLPLPNTVLHPKEGQHPLVWEQKPTQALALRYRKGLGQVGITLVPETFPLALEGKEQLYQQYWATILTALAKPEEAIPVTFVSQATPFLVNQPLSVLSAVPLTGASFTSVENKTPIYSSPLTNGSYTKGTMWPQKAGWHTLALNEKAKTSVYVHAATGWQTQHLLLQQQALLRAAANANDTHTAEGTQREEPISLWYMAGLLVALLGYLWLEEKL